MDNVLKEKLVSGEFNGFDRRVVQRQIVCVAGHRGHRGDEFQFRQNPRQPDVPAVQNVFNARK
jgi:hypothetical protein